MCRFIFNFLLFLVCLTIPCIAQPTKKEKTDLSSPVYRPTGLGIGFDVIPLVRSKDSFFKGYEVSAYTDFYRYYVTIDYGYWATDQSLKNGRYTNSGHYARIGGDVNFLLKDPDKNMFFLGLRYGMSFFKEAVSYVNLTSYKGFVSTETNRSNDNLFGKWVEITLGLRVKMIGNFWVGATSRLKFAPSVNNQENNLTTYDMPGYGLVEQTPYWGFNYLLIWRIPFRK